MNISHVVDKVPNPFGGNPQLTPEKLKFKSEVFNQGHFLGYEPDAAPASTIGMFTVGVI